MTNLYKSRGTLPPLYPEQEDQISPQEEVADRLDWESSIFKRISAGAATIGFFASLYTAKIASTIIVNSQNDNTERLMRFIDSYADYYDPYSSPSVLAEASTDKSQIIKLGVGLFISTLGIVGSVASYSRASSLTTHSEIMLAMAGKSPYSDGSGDSDV